MGIINLTAKQLRQAADLQERIQSLQSQLGKLLGGTVSEAGASAPAATRKRHISAKGKAAIAAAARARWARFRAASPAKPAPQPKRQLSEAARARLAALARARWRKVKAAGKTSL